MCSLHYELELLKNTIYSFANTVKEIKQSGQQDQVNNLKVTIAVGITSSHSEQRS